MPKAAAGNTGRFLIQITSAEKVRLMRADALERTSLEDLVLRNALQAAEAVIENAERISFGEEQTRFMLGILDNPPAPNARLLAAARSLSAGK